MLDLIECPETGCDAPAEVIERFQLRSTDGMLECARTFCVHGHVLIVPAASAAQRL